MIIADFILTDNPQQRKAPRGKMYKVSSIHFINLTAEAGTLLWVGDWNVHPTRITDSDEPRNWLALHECDAIHSNQVFEIDEQTKFLITGKNSSTLINGRVTIYGDLVRATRTQLLIEWFRKGM